MHAFRVQYICLIIDFCGFFAFFMLCFYMKQFRDQMDYDGRRPLARIVTETCAAISRRLNVFLTERTQVGGRAVWKISRIQNVLEHEFLHFSDRKRLESYRVSKDMFEQLMHDSHRLPYYSWNVTNHMRPTISGPDLRYQAPTYNIRPRHTISGPQTKQRFRSCSKRFSPRTAGKIHEHFDQQNGTKLFFPQLCFIPFSICHVSNKIVKQRRPT